MKENRLEAGEVLEALPTKKAKRFYRNNPNPIHNPNSNFNSNSNHNDYSADEEAAFPFELEQRMLQKFLEKEGAISTKLELPEVTDPMKLVFAKKVMAEFNSGNVEVIGNYIVDTLESNCRIYLEPLNYELFGPISLHSLLVSLFESFPNGFFKSSETNLDTNGIVKTSFSFTGVKLFDLVFLSEHSNKNSNNSSSNSNINSAQSSNIGNTINDIVSASSSLPNSNSTSTSSQQQQQQQQLLPEVEGVSGVDFDRSHPQLSSTQLLLKAPHDVHVVGTITAKISKQGKMKAISVHWAEKAR